MKRKLAALLATVLVMTMGATTVFAAVSPENKPANTVEGTAVVDGKEVKVETTDVAPEVKETVAETAKAEVEKVEAEYGVKVANAKVAVLTDVTVDGYVQGTDVTIQFTVDVKPGELVLVLNHNGTEWVPAKGVSVSGTTVTATFNHLSPVMIITYTAEKTPADGGNNTTTDAAPASPKTGVVVPVAAIAAGICLAGAAVCGKKVKFN